MNKITPQPVQSLENNLDLEAVPSGAFTLAGVAVGLLVLAWFAMYLFIFIPRGPVG